MTYKGKYRPKNKKKYRGDYNDVTYRSHWELQVFKWMDANPYVVEWNSEGVVIPYICSTDNRQHRYFVDIYVKYQNGVTSLIEIKPNKQTKPPRTPKKKTKKYLTEVTTYIKNQSKWHAAKAYAENRGWNFEIWTEKTIKAKGIRLMT